MSGKAKTLVSPKVNASQIKASMVKAKNTAGYYFLNLKWSSVVTICNLAAYVLLPKFGSV